jgi:hypothetical protein
MGHSVASNQARADASELLFYLIGEDRMDADADRCLRCSTL